MESFCKGVSVMVAGLMAVHSPVVIAATPIRWTGQGTDTTSWTDADNWFGGVVPTILESAAFRPIGGTISVDLGSLDQSLGGFNIQDSTTTLSVASFITINSSLGKKLTLAGDIGFLNATKTVSRTLTLNLPVEIYNSGNWDIIGATDAIVVSGALSSAAGQSSTITKAGLGTLTLSGNNASHNGGFNFQAGTLNVNHANALGAGAFIINGSGLKLNNSSGASVTINGVSGITLASDFTFTGSNDLNFGSAAVSLGANAGSTRSITVQDSNLVIGGIISNGTNGITPTTGLVKSGAGKLTLSGANTFTGGVTISQGVLAISNDAALGTTAAGTSLATGTTLEISGGITVADDITSAGSTLSNLSGSNSLTGLVNLTANTEIQTASGSTLTLSQVSSANSITKSGAGTLVMATGGTYGLTGQTVITGGTLTADAEDSIGSGLLTISNGATLGIGANDQTTNGLTLTSGNITGSGGILNTGTGVVILKKGLISANLAGTGVVTIEADEASDVLTLSGTNTFSGQKNLNKGTVQIGSNAAFGTGELVLASGVTVSSNGVAVAGDYTIGNAFTTGATLTLGDATKTGVLTFGGSGTLTGDLALTAA
ncbi:MAG: hypothetical protein RIS92_2136, partial [Verrucomicrobiota bacterium]